MQCFGAPRTKMRELLSADLVSRRGRSGRFASSTSTTIVSGRVTCVSVRGVCDFDHVRCPHPCMRSCTHLCSIFPHTRITSANGVGDNVQAFEEKFNIFLMLDPALLPSPPGNITPPDTKDAMVNKTWTTLLQPPRHAYTKSWCGSLIRTVM